MPDIDIETAANAPKSATTDAGSVTAHSLPELIAAKKHVDAQAAIGTPRRGLRFSTFRPPGATGER